MKSILEFTFEELKKELLDNGYKSFRVKQIYPEIYKRFNLSFDNMTSISKEDRERLKSEYSLFLPVISRELKEEETGTSKFNLQLTDGNIIETVIIFADGRITQCVSSQVGCILNCGFCATARLKFERSLTVHEYIAQVLLTCSRLGQRPTNLVFMGMGEPLNNTDTLIKAISILTDSNGLDFGLRKITVSTSGILDQLEKLLISFPNIGIAISLNSTFDHVRDKLMPINTRFPVKEIFRFLKEKEFLFKRRPTLEYILIKGVNDSKKEARNLVKLADKIRCKINLIPFNPFPDCGFECSVKKDIDAFKEILMKGKNAVTFRESAGSKIYAACGQLANIQDDEI